MFKVTSVIVEATNLFKNNVVYIINDGFIFRLYYWRTWWIDAGLGTYVTNLIQLTQRDFELMLIFYLLK